ncbi:chromate transport protein [Alistipes sp. CAG:831]|nr:chromate transport protein [Alistipes sp. CAG:831]
MYWKLFSIFAKIGAFTIGGGVAMIPLIEREIVYKNKWISSEEFLDIISIAQSAPGLIAVNVSIFVGHRIAGIKGSIVATIGSVMPPFIIILLVAAVFTTFKDNQTVQAVFKGIRPAVVALIAAPVFRMAVQNRLNWITGSIAVAATVLIAFLKISPIWIIVTAIAGGLIVAYSRQDRDNDKKEVKR